MDFTLVKISNVQVYSNWCQNWSSSI